MNLDNKQIDYLTLILGSVLFGIALIFCYTGNYETTTDKLVPWIITITIISAGFYEGLKKSCLKKSE